MRQSSGLSFAGAVLITVFSFAVCHSQNKNTFQEIRKFKRYNDYILVTTADSPDSAFATMIRLLKVNGIPVALTGKAQGYLKTEFHPVAGFMLRFHIRIKKSYDISKIFIRGEFLSEPVIHEGFASFDPRFRRTGDQLAHNKCFGLMYEFAAQYPSGKIKPKANLELDRWLPNGVREVILTTGATKSENSQLILKMLATHNLLGNGPMCDSIFSTNKFILDEAVDDDSFDTELSITLTASDKTITIAGYESDESFLSAMIDGNIRWTRSRRMQYNDHDWLSVKAFRELLKVSEHLGSFETTYKIN